MKTAFSAAAVLVLAPLAIAQTGIPQRSQYTIQLSTDGSNWTRNLSADPASGPVFARLSIDYIANGGPTATYLNGARGQPLTPNWRSTAGDRVLPFTPQARVVPDYSLTDGDGYQLGRVLGAAFVSEIRSFEYVLNGVEYMRIAEATATFHPGQGSGSNNVTGLLGINTSNPLLGPFLGTSDLELFVWGMSFDASRRGELAFDVPLNAVRTSPTSANPPATRSSTWGIGVFPNLSFIEAPMIETRTATLTFVPSPASLALLALAPLAVRRRR